MTGLGDRRTGAGSDVQVEMSDADSRKKRRGEEDQDGTVIGGS